MQRLTLFVAAVLVAGVTVPAAAQTKINFGPDAGLDAAAYPEFTGYLGDDGSAYGDRGNGHTCGWFNGAGEPDPQAQNRNRNNEASADERYDTLNHMIKGDNNSWQIDLPNGDYSVLLVAGDPNHTDQINDLSVSGGAEALILEDIDGQDNFDEYSFSYSVTEGYLRLSPNPGDDLGKNQKLAFIEIVPEPGSFGLIAMGLIPLFGMLRRRQK